MHLALCVGHTSVLPYLAPRGTHGRRPLRACRSIARLGGCRRSASRATRAPTLATASAAAAAPRLGLARWPATVAGTGAGGLQGPGDQRGACTLAGTTTEAQRGSRTNTGWARARLLRLAPPQSRASPQRQHASTPLRSAASRPSPWRSEAAVTTAAMATHVIATQATPAAAPAHHRRQQPHRQRGGKLRGGAGSASSRGPSAGNAAETARRHHRQQCSDERGRAGLLIIRLLGLQHTPLHCGRADATASAILTPGGSTSVHGTR
jgi:hypothetical protein